MRQLCNYLVAVALLVVASPGWAITSDAGDRTRTHTIESRQLDEQRTLLVRMPPGYRGGEKLATVFVLDGEWNFELVASYLDYMADNGVYPRLLVTAVTNVNRNRDFVPRADKYFDDTGGADRFLDFVAKEWLPFIAENYPASDNRILIGHSFGGVFTLHSLFSGRDLFDAYIALGSSAWIGDRVLFEEAEAWFRTSPNASEFVYMAVGQGDGGPTVPSSQALADLFESRAPASLEWTFEITPRTDHFKNTVSGMHDGFMRLFPAWNFAEELQQAATDGGAKAVDDWFAAGERELGYRFMPAWFDLGVTASALARNGRLEAALAITRQLRRYHPYNPHVAAFSAGVYELSGQADAAAGEYRRAIEIAQADGLHPNEIHLDRLRRGLARVEETQR